VTNPAPVVTVMRELDIDLVDRAPQRVTDALAQWADVVVAMGCGDECPYIPGKCYLDWDLPDPKGRPIDDVRATRDDIASRIQALMSELVSRAPLQRSICPLICRSRYAMPLPLSPPMIARPSGGAVGRA
jgi:hypothetical protein